MANKDKNESHDNDEPVVRDKRRIDPETGDVREPTTVAGDDPAAGSPPDRS